MPGDHMTRNSGKIVGVCAAALALAVVAAARAGAEDNRPVAQMVAEYVKAWNAGDTEALERMWAADGELINVDGEPIDRKSLMESKLVQPKGERPVLSIELKKVRMIAPNVAMIEGESVLTAPGGGSIQRTRFDGLISKQNDAWQIRLIRSLSARPHVAAAPEEPLKDLEWLVGQWVGIGDGMRVHTTTERDLGGRYLVSQSEYEPESGKPYQSEMRAGWDPETRSIKSWYFDSRGVISTSTWQKIGEQWLAKVSGTQRDGEEFTATMAITPVDKDSYLRTLLNMQVAGKTTPDQEVRMFRVDPQQPAQ